MTFVTRLADRVRARRLQTSSSLVLAIANLSELALPLTRGIILARLLEPAQFGLAISVTMIANAMELISDLGISQQALRSGTKESLATLHSISIVRGAALAVVIALAGPLFALLFNAPGTAWVYSLVGLSSFIKSFSHLETRIRMREYHYTPEALSTLGMQSIWTVVSVVSALLLRDYRAMVIGLVGASIGTVAITHLCSSSRYRLGWDKEIVREAIRFGRPLTANGVALVIGSVGDRFLIGSRIGLEQLAQYTALSTAAFMPRSIVTKFATSLFVPQFINAIGENEKRRLANTWVVLITTVGGIFGFCYIGLGQLVVSTAFGRHYLPDQASVSLIAGLACIRYMAIIPNAPSLAAGRTSFVLLNTSLATSGLVLGAISLAIDRNLHLLIGAMIVGEGLGLCWVLHKLAGTIPMSRLVLWTAVLEPVLTMVVVAVAVATLPNVGMGLRLALCGLGIAAQVGCALMLLRQSGSNVSSLLRMLLPERQPVLHPVADASS